MKVMYDLAAHEGETLDMRALVPDTSRSRIVGIATVHRASTTWLCPAMADNEFEVGTLVPDDHVYHALDVASDLVGARAALNLPRITLCAIGCPATKASQPAADAGGPSFEQGTGFARGPLAIAACD